MNKQEFKKLKNIKLSDSEKRDLFDRVRARTGDYELDYPIKSPFFGFSYLATHRYAQIGAMAMLFIFISGATSYASLNTLPGDMLYGVKTRVVEKIPRILYTTPEAKAEDNVRKIEKRITEFELLAEKGRLSEENTQKIEKEIEKHLGQFDEQIKEIKEVKQKEEEAKEKAIEEAIGEVKVSEIEIPEDPATPPEESDAAPLAQTAAPEDADLLNTMMLPKIEAVEEETLELEDHLNERLQQHAERILEIREEEIQETEKVLESILERAASYETEESAPQIID